MMRSRLFGPSVFALVALAPGYVRAQAAPEPDRPPTIRVEGSATVEREPDRAILILAVESEATTAQAASQANAALMTRVIAALREESLTGQAVRTLSLRLEPVYSPGQNRESPRIVGYRARNQVQVTIDEIARVGRVIDGAITAGSNRVDGLTFAIRDAEEARLEALAAAVENARRQAEVVAAAANGVLGPPIEIVLSPVPTGPRPIAFERGLAMAQAVETPVEAGPITVRADVMVIYRLDLR